MSALKLAVIGGGPSAFYVASRILKLQPEAQNIRIHLFDRLWAPHGLVRYGVAPDHPENCTHKFAQAAEDTRLRFFGNVDVGDTARTVPHALQLPLGSIFKNYSHVLFATGCTLPTLHDALPPSAYCIPALSLVHWYTQHPSGPPPPALDKLSHVSLIGNGNVSLDVARMLLTNVDVLAKYDVPEPVLDVLSRSTIKHVSIIGRRGPLEAAFTMKELREMINLPEASMVPLNSSLITPSASASDPPLTRQQTRVLRLLQQGSKCAPGSTSKTWSLDFFRAPIGITPPPGSSSSAQLSLAHTSVDPKTSRAVPTGEVSTLSTDLVVTSLGFHGEPTVRFYDPGLRHLRAIEGRIVTSDGHILKNVYASGWAATGAKGVLATTMMNAYGVADAILSDWKATSGKEQDAVADPQVHDLPPLNANPVLDDVPEEVQKALEQKTVTQYDDWRKIDQEEVRRGEVLGKERERMGWAEARHLIS
ncbi:NADPH:adrenodoxin oxidoreductase, mitochondrial [Psilocybe cubensis]|uniref:NADPH:adrenodoxin oxidoreductase, mitochondrial n=1 Tax=Psilocybe cubensis TaxID=181762 RepID=A0ACB8GJ87_PSICU|nr:NADPH:adrenodoxin oxidoreductase, mitochondrial [Psilocybe cubensis]KAH9475559.1 NADPH:adrenodoxin oxidoreductase, mitochondrial [Psilocybe cubensis]